MAQPGMTIRGELRISAVDGRDWTATAGFWSGLLTTAAILAFDLAVAIGFAGPDMAIASVAASLAIAPPFVALIVSVHHRAARRYRAWTGIGIAYAGIYATLVVFNYMLQLTVVRHAPSAYGWLSMALNGDTAFWAFETFGYAFMSLAVVFAIPGMLDMRFARLLTWLFAVNLATSLAGLAVYVATADPVHPVIIGGLGVWGLLFPIGTSLLTLQFWRERRD